MSVTCLEESSWFDTAPNSRLDADRPISELMTTSAQASALVLKMPSAPAVSAFATVREVAHLMAARRLAQVRVRDARGEIVGVVSTSDLYRWVVDAALDDRDKGSLDEGSA
jgi:CBS domain-containing protein